MKIVVIVPTYNERDNIGRLIDALQKQFKQLEHSMSILVVDDNSPDGTADVVRESMSEFDNVELLIGDKAGLGSAYIRGMRHALNKMCADAVFEMDADFSHKPEDVPRLVAELEKGADFVIGSRYVAGGSIPPEWGAIRKMNSLFGNIVARYVAGLHKVRDCSAGFRVIRAALLRDIGLEGLRVQGYAFQVSLLHRAIVEGAKIKEIPVEFVDRTHGESKLGLSDIVEFILVAGWIRFLSLRTFIKFGIVGVSGIAVNLLTFTLLLGAGVGKYFASPIAIELSIIWNFFLNNHWTFRWRRNNDQMRIKGLKFNIVSFVSLGVSYATFVVLSMLYPDVPPQIHQFIGVVPASFLNYFMNSYWTFRHQPEIQEPIR